MARPLVIQTEHLDERAAAWLGERCEVVRCAPEEDGFGALLERADGLVIRTYTRVDEALLGRAQRLRVVGRAGVGLDNVDLHACAARGVTVVHTPAANTRAVVEFVLALVLDVMRPRVTLEGARDVQAWKSLRAGLIADKQLSDVTLGICGLGRIGSQVARAAAALDVHVIYHDLVEIPEQRRFGAQPVGFDELLQRSDVLTLHVDGRSSNRGLIGDTALAHCAPNLVLINTSRGFVVDAGALAAFLRANPRARAALDVHDPEPFGPNYPLLGLEGARLTPHIAAATATAHANMSWVVRDVWRVLNGEHPEFAADAEDPGLG